MSPDFSMTRCTTPPQGLRNLSPFHPAGWLVNVCRLSQRSSLHPSSSPPSIHPSSSSLHPSSFPHSYPLTSIYLLSPSSLFHIAFPLSTQQTTATTRYLIASDVKRSSMRNQHCRLASIANSCALHVHMFIRITKVHIQSSAKSPRAKSQGTCAHDPS